MRAAKIGTFTSTTSPSIKCPDYEASEERGLSGTLTIDTPSQAVAGGFNRSEGCSFGGLLDAVSATVSFDASEEA
jgi:hypothetical protein